MANLPAPFDEAVYLALNPDVAEAVRTGDFASGAAHFEAHGRQEGRSHSPPADFDQAAYLARYPEVAAEVAAGRIASAGLHYVKFGRAQGLRYARDSEVRREVLQALWHGRDPFTAFPAGVYAVDKQGWNSGHDYLTRAVREVRPRIVVEVGVWKGGSTLTMAKALRELEIDGVVIAIDTWLGSSDHWMSPALFNELGFETGYPRLYHKFMANVASEGLQDYVVPLPIDSLNAHVVVKASGLRPEVAHIDAGHDYASVTADLNAWWSMLAPGGMLVADDYFPGGGWPEVLKAVDDFFAVHPHAGFEAIQGKAMVRKPA
jgi:hypothetical protein